MWGNAETLQLQLWLGAETAHPFENVCNHENTTHGDPQGTAAAANGALASSDALHRALYVNPARPARLVDGHRPGDTVRSSNG